MHSYSLVNTSGHVLYEFKPLESQEPTVSLALTEAVRKGIPLPGIDLRNIVLHEVCLDNLKAPGADLSGSRLVRVSLMNADLSNANVAGAEFKLVSLRDANTAAVDFSTLHIQESLNFK